MKLPMYLPVELAIQNYSLKLRQWKLCHAQHESVGNDGSAKDLQEARRQLDQQEAALRRALAQPLE